MTRPFTALAAALIAGAALSTSAEAGGGIRLGFGVPLGSFVASPFSQGSMHSNKSGGYDRMMAERRQRDRAKAAAAKQAAAKQHAIAKQQAAAKQQAIARAEAEAKAQKAKLAKTEQAPAAIETAKVEANQTQVDTSLRVNIPNPPEKVEKTAAATTGAEIATVGEISDATVIVAPAATTLKQAVKVEKDEPATVTVADKVDAPATTNVAEGSERVCRRFSAVIGGLLDVPCE